MADEGSNLDRAASVTGPVFVSGFGWRVSVDFHTEPAAQGFAAFATARGEEAHDRGAPVVIWRPAGSGDDHYMLPPRDSFLRVLSVDTRSEGVVVIFYHAIGVG